MAGRSEPVVSDGWTEPFSGPVDLLDLRLANGFHLECLEPLTAYRIRHQSEQVDLDISFRALMEPNPFLRESHRACLKATSNNPAASPVRSGWAISVIASTARPYGTGPELGPRTMRPGIRIGNAHGTGMDGWASLRDVNPDDSGTEHITSGYWQKDGQAARLVTGKRQSEMTGDFAHTITVDARDALRTRHLVVRGRCANRQALDAGHDLYAVLNLIEWDNGSGTDAWGENHDIWSKHDWLAADRDPLPEAVKEVVSEISGRKSLVVEWFVRVNPELG